MAKKYLDYDGTSYLWSKLKAYFVAKTEVADYVVEEDESSGWHYRKWKSGKVEAWVGLSNASASWSTWVSPIRYMDKTFTIPSGIFSTAPNVMATSQSSQYWVVDANASSATSGNMRIATVASSAMATYMNVYAWENATVQAN